MKYPVFCIRDVKTGFMSPTIDQNVPAATRNFEHAVRNSASLMNSHPQDYQLFCIGEFDSDSGALTPKEVIEHICDAADLL